MYIMYTVIEIIYIIFMWNYFKTTYSFHNIWEARVMDLKKIPNFFKHEINTGDYSSKICPLGNFAAYGLAAWILIRDLYLKKSKGKIQLNVLIFSIVAFFSFVMNLNAFIYFIPVFIYEFFKYF